MKIAIPAQNIRMDQPTGVDPIWYAALKQQAGLSNLFSGFDPNALVDGQVLVWNAAQKTFLPGPTTWTTYTPTFSTTSGSITTAAASGRYSRLGKSVFISLQLNVTTNGTGAGFVILSLPFAAVVAQTMVGRENAVTGKVLGGAVLAGTSNLFVFNYDNTYPAVNGAQLLLTGIYESA